MNGLMTIRCDIPRSFGHIDVNCDNDILQIFKFINIIFVINLFLFDTGVIPAYLGENLGIENDEQQQQNNEEQDHDEVFMSNDDNSWMKCLNSDGISDEEVSLSSDRHNDGVCGNLSDFSGDEESEIGIDSNATANVDLMRKYL